MCDGSVSRTQTEGSCPNHSVPLHDLCNRTIKSPNTRFIYRCKKLHQIQKNIQEHCFLPEGLYSLNHVYVCTAKTNRLSVHDCHCRYVDNMYFINILFYCSL